MQKDTNRTALFETMPVPKAVMSLAVPTMLGMLVTVIYNLADTYFVGQMNDANAVAAVTLTAPFFTLLMALGNLFGIGGGSYISRLLGAHDEERVRRVSAFCTYASIAVGLVTAVVAVLLTNPMLSLFGASGDDWQPAWEYLIVISVGAPTVILNFALGQIIRSEGASRQSMTGMMIGTLLNIALDPVLILWLGLGVFGAALATVFANAVAIVYYLCYMAGRKSVLSIRPRDARVDGDMMKNIMAIGVPGTINNVLFSVVNVLLNNYAVAYGTAVVAGIGIAFKVNMLPVLLLIGLSQGAQPLLGYNYGAGDRRRMSSVMKFSILTGVAASVVFAVLLIVFGEPVVRMFIRDEAVVEFGSAFLKATMLAIPILPVTFVLSSLFQSMGKGVAALVMSLSRQGIVYVPVLLIGTAFFGLNGLIFVEPIADVGATVMAVILFAVIWRKPFPSELAGKGKKTA